MTNHAFADLLNGENDRGVVAVLETLSEIGALRYDHPNDCYISTEMRISSEALKMKIEKKLRRH
jgi:hypothetical protein